MNRRVCVTWQRERMKARTCAQQQRQTCLTVTFHLCAWECVHARCVRGVFHTRWRPEIDRHKRSKIKWWLSTKKRKYKNEDRNYATCVFVCMCLRVHFSPRKYPTPSAPWRPAQKRACHRSSLMLLVEIRLSYKWKIPIKSHIVHVFSPASEWWQTLSRWRTSTSAACTGQPGTWC